MGHFELRISQVCDELEIESSNGISASESLAAFLEEKSSWAELWFSMAVILAEMPTQNQVRDAKNKLIIDGGLALLRSWEHSRNSKAATMVEVVRDAVIVDVRHTSETDLATGIQRVARETVRRWNEMHDVQLITWTLDGTAMRLVTPAEKHVALWGGKPTRKYSRKTDQRIVIPWRGTYLLPELAAEAWRTSRVAALAEFSNTRSCVIGFDCVPLTSGETVADGMPGAFGRNLGVVAHMDVVAAISNAAASEYLGWKKMLTGLGLKGPAISAVSLASHTVEPSGNDLSGFNKTYLLNDWPLVLVVGSHEPRKNHQAVLRVAEILWKSGEQFQLMFIGGNSWNSERFESKLSRLRAMNAPVITATALSDSEIYSAIKTARFSVFPSLNEGFGLPVAESLGLGTPVITSNFGSMQEIPATGGALFVNPRSISDLKDAFGTLLHSDEEYARLKRKAGLFSPVTWDLYAEKVWNLFFSNQLG